MIIMEEFKIVPITHGRIIDLTSKTYGRLVVLGLSPIKKGNNRSWVCQCECGNRTIVLRGDLTSGKTSSCGCYLSEQTSKRNSIYKTTHGQSGDRLHGIWINMKQRCTNLNDDAYQNYGARGIEVCQEWEESYISFRDWAHSNGYQDDLSIDRIDNNGNYEPSNCHWSTPTQQNNNKRNNVLIEYQNKKQTIPEWSRITGINKSTLYSRHARGVTGDRLFRPVQK